MSGRGKSTLIQALLRQLAAHNYNYIVIDSKNSRDELPAWKTVGEQVKGNRIFKVGAGQYVWHAPLTWALDFTLQNRFFLWAFRAGNRIIVNDEILNSTPGPNRFPRWYHIAVTQGRSIGLGMWGLTQRPSGVPLWTISESNYAFTFSVAMPDDRRRIDAVLEQQVPWNSLRQPHSFVWRDPKGNLHGPWVLKKRL